MLQSHTTPKNPANSRVKRYFFSESHIFNAINHLQQKKNGTITTANPVSLKQWK